jgi:predicted CoA-binding protein
MSDAFLTMEHENPSEAELRSLLERVRRIAVVGLSPKPHRDSNRVGRYLLDRGYDVVPIYPREETILGQKVYRRVQDVPGGVDLVDVFRRREELPKVFDDALAAGAPAIWLQLDCIDEDGARRATAAGATVVMDRCLAVDHAQLLGRNWRPPSSVPTQLGLKATKT